jgi:hypothetical protein
MKLDDLSGSEVSGLRIPQAEDGSEVLESF